MSLTFATITKLFYDSYDASGSAKLVAAPTRITVCFVYGKYESVVHSYSFYGRFSISRCSALPLIGILVWVRM